MTVVLDFVRDLLNYLKEGKAGEIINMISQFIKDLFNPNDDTAE